MAVSAPPTPRTLADDLVSALDELVRAQREAGSRLARNLDWPRAELGVLRLLHRCGRVQIGDVASRLRVDVSVASRQVSALVDAGFVRRTVDDVDRRVRTLELTDEGRAVAERTTQHFEQYVSTVFDGWTQDQLADATRQIRRVAAAITTIDADQEDI